MKALLTFTLLILCLKVAAQTSLTVATNRVGEIVPGKISGKHAIIIPMGDSVVLLSYSSKVQAWYAQYYDVTGVIADSLINQSPEYTAFKKTFIARDHKAEMISKYGPVNGAAIATGIVKIGMTKAMVEDAYGKPDNINRIWSGSAMQEQWVYERLPSGKPGYFTFVNGKLKSRKD